MMRSDNAIRENNSGHACQAAVTVYNCDQSNQKFIQVAPRRVALFKGLSGCLFRGTIRLLFVFACLFLHYNRHILLEAGSVSLFLFLILVFFLNEIFHSI